MHEKNPTSVPALAPLPLAHVNLQSIWQQHVATAVVLSIVYSRDRLVVHGIT